MTISMAILSVCLVGIINLGYCEKDKDKDKDKEEIPFDCIQHETQCLKLV
jgi:hypothetical protein